MAFYLTLHAASLFEALKQKGEKKMSTQRLNKEEALQDFRLCWRSIAISNDPHSKWSPYYMAWEKANKKRLFLFVHYAIMFVV